MTVRTARRSPSRAGAGLFCLRRSCPGRPDTCGALVGSHTGCMSTSDSGRVPWALVGVFYAIAFGGAILLSAVLALAGTNFGTGQVAIVAQLVVGAVYMPLPLVAALVTDRLAGRAPGRALVARIRSPRPARLVVVSAATILLLGIVGLLTVVALGAILGVGQLATSSTDVTANLARALPDAPPPASVPPAPVLYGLMLLAGLVAGFTVNGLFAFGEEYGWRGVLTDLLAPLGETRSSILVGVLWGLWHAPLIVLGFNYGEYRLQGIALMCVWTVPLSFILARARAWSGSVLAPAVIHGGINAMGGFAVLLIADRDPRMSLPAGLAAAVGAALVALACARLFPSRSDPRPEATAAA